MRFASRLLILAAAILLSAVAEAEICTCGGADGVESANWTGVTNDPASGGTSGILWDGTCTPSADDDFAVGSGCTVTLTGDLIFTTGSIDTNSGGVFQAIVTTSTQGLRITQRGGSVGGGDGFDCNTGGVCRLKGGYRSYGVSPAVVDATQSTTPGRYWQVGSVLPCPHAEVTSTPDILEPQCGSTAGNESHVRFEYPTAVYDQGSGSTYADPHFDTSLAALDDEVTNSRADVVCGFDPDLSDAYAPPETNFCYWVNDIATAPTLPDATAIAPYVQIDVRETSQYDPSDENIYPLAQRQVKECILQATVERGSRTVSCASGFIAASAEREGFWIYFQDNLEPCNDDDATACTVWPRPYRIANTVDGGAGADTLTLADSRGVDRSFNSVCGAGSCRAWVMPAGFVEGDPVSIWAPVVFRSATTGRATALDENDSSVEFGGADEVQAVVFDATARTVTQTSLPLWRDVWLVDVCSTDHIKGLFNSSAPAGTYTYDHHLTTGTCEISGDTTGEGATTQEGTVSAGATFVFNDFASRYMQATMFALTGGPNAKYTVNRFRGQYRAKAGVVTTTACINQDDSSDSAFNDVECIDAAATFSSGTGGNTVTGLVAIGGAAHTQTANTGANDTLRNATFIGSKPTIGAISLLDDWEVLDGFLIRNVLMQTGTGRVVIVTSPTTVTRNGLVIDTEAGSAIYRFEGASTDHTIDNVAMLDVDAPVTLVGVLSQGSGPPTVHMSRLTMAWPFGAIAADYNISTVYSVATAPGAGSTIKDLTIARYPETNAAMDGANGEGFAWSGCIATFANPSDFGATLNTDFGNGSITPLPTFVRSVPPGFLDLARERAGIPAGRPGRGCGASDSAGITAPYWALSLSLLEPESLGVVLGGGGGRRLRVY